MQLMENIILMSQQPNVNRFEKKSEAWKTEKERKRTENFWRQDVPRVRIPEMSCLASSRSRQDVADRNCSTWHCQVWNVYFFLALPYRYS